MKRHQQLLQQFTHELHASEPFRIPINDTTIEWLTVVAILAVGYMVFRQL